MLSINLLSPDLKFTSHVLDVVDAGEIDVPIREGEAWSVPASHAAPCMVVDKSYLIEIIDLVWEESSCGNRRLQRWRRIVSLSHRVVWSQYGEAHLSILSLRKEKEKKKVRCGVWNRSEKRELLVYQLSLNNTQQAVSFSPFFSDFSFTHLIDWSIDRPITHCLVREIVWLIDRIVYPTERLTYF